MINEVTSTKINRKVIDVEKKGILNFIDGEGFDHLLGFILKGLFYGVIFFCIPYFLFMMLSL